MTLWQRLLDGTERKPEQVREQMKIHTAKRTDGFFNKGASHQGNETDYDTSTISDLVVLKIDPRNANYLTLKAMKDENIITLEISRRADGTIDIKVKSSNIVSKEVAEDLYKVAYSKFLESKGGDFNTIEKYSWFSDKPKIGKIMIEKKDLVTFTSFLVNRNYSFLGALLFKRLAEPHNEADSESLMKKSLKSLLKTATEANTSLDG